MSQRAKVELGVVDHHACIKVDSGAVSSAAVPTFAEEGDVAFIALNRELDQHIQMGRLDAAEVGVLTLIHLQCDYRTLTWPGSAAKVASLLRVTEKQARRILESLESKGFINRQTTPGRRGNYPVQLTALAGRDMGKLESTTTTTNEKEIPYNDRSNGRASVDLVASSGHQVGQSSTSIITNTRTKKDKPLVPPDPRHTQFKEYYFMAYREHRGMPEDGTVAWGPADAGQLNNLLKANPTVPIEALKRWFLNWWKSDVNRSAMPHTWLMKLPNYREGALDRFGKPMYDSFGFRVGSAQ